MIERYDQMQLINQSTLLVFQTAESPSTAYYPTSLVDPLAVDPRHREVQYTGSSAVME